MNKMCNQIMFVEILFYRKSTLNKLEHSQIFIIHLLNLKYSENALIFWITEIQIDFLKKWFSKKLENEYTF
jgi:hypothetical protein